MGFRWLAAFALTTPSSSSQVDLALPVTKVHFDLTAILSTVAQNAVVMETRGLTRCLLSETTTKSGEKETVLNTEGINMHEMFKYGDVRMQRCSPNPSQHLGCFAHCGFQSRAQISRKL